MDLQLKGKSAIVTGASRGIGRAIAESLAREGCKLAICARGEDDLATAAKELRALGGQVEALALDITAEGAAEELVGEARQRLGSVDVVVGNVGGNRRGAVENLSLEDWQWGCEVNFLSQVRLAKAAATAMDPEASRKTGDSGDDGTAGAGGGSMVFIASIFGREAGGSHLGIYNSTKSALISMCKILALEMAPRGIRVNSVAPGSIRFPGGSWDRRCRDDPKAMEGFIEENLPLGRFGQAHEVADVVTFLASPKASLVTGACWTVDGGQSRSLI